MSTSLYPLPHWATNELGHCYRNPVTLTCWIEATVLIVATGGDLYSNNDVIIPKNGKQIEIFQQKLLITISLNDFGPLPLPYN